ncbi:homeobox protein CDX-4-like [Bombina bombina]|uniref:homeobox protein CDX-4-like n=1 Tax=Bombina bombina TaxID=8345 RepID=UPI00235B0ED0|nr:homeobox protein CDX-4-like [Bombina bombina]
MHVSYFEDRENNMDTGARKWHNSCFPTPNFVSYTDYMGYQHAPHMDNQMQPSGVWGTLYGQSGEEWNEYGPEPTNTSSTAISGLPCEQMNYNSVEYNAISHCGSEAMSFNTMNIVQISNDNQRNQPYQWTRKTCLIPKGNTRTKEKYRVVYTDHQRLELEKEFLSNKYITIRRKSEIALSLGLSDRQVKIWFQNRRAKERKLIKKIRQFDNSISSAQSDSGSISPADMSASLFSQQSTMNNLQSLSKLHEFKILPHLQCDSTMLLLTFGTFQLPFQSAVENPPHGNSPPSKIEEVQQRLQLLYGNAIRLGN